MNRANADPQSQPPRAVYAPYLWAFGGIILLSALVAGFSDRPKEVPQELQGIWTTTDTAHVDRFLEISGATVSFGLGNGAVSTGFIRKVEEESGGRETKYTITYNDDEGERKVCILYDPGKRELRLKNQDRIVWVKTGEA